jgi:hypothetical protein
MARSEPSATITTRVRILVDELDSPADFGTVPPLATHHKRGTNK